jgi:putative glutamine amidotransferase
VARPLVAVPGYPLVAGRVTGWKEGASAVPAEYIDALRRAGLRPAILSAPDPGSAREILEPFDALVLIGGGDVDPARYGAARHPAVYGVDPDRDDLELALAREAVDAGLPLLAICRGLQVLNVALGGTLHQHLADLLGMGQHGRANTDGTPVVHDVTVAPASRLAEIAGEAGVFTRCTSVHHQAVDRVGQGLVVTARSADGVIEAIESPPGQGWVLAVQWHPERTAAVDSQQQALFDALAAVLPAGRDRLAR